MIEKFMGPRFIRTSTMGNKVLTQDNRGVFCIPFGEKSGLPGDNRVLDFKGNTIGRINLPGTANETVQRW